MRTDLIRHALIAKMAALALLTFGLVDPNVCASQPINLGAAQTGGTFTLTFNGQTGLARGQVLRLTASNGNEPGTRGGSEPAHAVATLYDAHGNTIAESVEVEIHAGEFRSIDFDREELQLAGEPGTGRVQVRAQIRYLFSEIVEAEQFSPPSIEVIDKTSGMTTVLVPPSRANDRLRAAGPSDVALGIIPGQTLRLTMFNSSELGSPEGAEPILAQVKLFDAQGHLIAESSEVLIRAGEFHSFDFNRSTLPLAGEPGSSRAQIRTLPLWSARASGRLGPEDIPASLEIVDNGTGRTTAATSSKPKEIVVVGL
jgi:hypothetical protein